MTRKEVPSEAIAEALTKAPVYSICIGRVGKVIRVDANGLVHIRFPGRGTGVTRFDHGDNAEMVFEHGQYIIRNPELWSNVQMQGGKTF